MNLILITLCLLLESTEASRFFLPFLCGGSDENGKQPKCRRLQVLPSNEVTTADFEDKYDLNSFYKKNQVVPIALSQKSERTRRHSKKLCRFFEENDLLIDCSEFSFSEKGSKNLLEIQAAMRTVLSLEKRLNLILKELDRANITGSYADSRLEFNDEISEDLSNVRNLKDFLKTVIKFYKNRLSETTLSKCILAIMASTDLFNLQDLTEILNLSDDQMFQIACENRLNDLAKELFIKSKEELYLYEGVLAAYKDHNMDLFMDLLARIGDIYGRQEGSKYHRILCKVADFKKSK